MYGFEQLPSRFIRHEPCPNCHSKDNLARYEGGSGFCFGCGFYERPSQYQGSGGIQSGLSEMDRGRGKVPPTESGNDLRPPPDDTVLGEYPVKVIEWVGKYGLTAIDLIKYNIGWSKKREQLIYQFFSSEQSAGAGLSGEGKDLVLWQARNFREGTTHRDRFFTSGSSIDIVASYYPREVGSKACIVEDCISAIVVSKAGVTGIPCLGSSMPAKKLLRISKLYKNIFVWLDADKLKESQKIARQLGMLGCHTRVIFTNEDPKCYRIDEIERRLT